jgi:hypothetical protein
MTNANPQKGPEPIHFQHIAVKSSTVKSVAYDPESETLEVRFVNGGLYRYAKVSPDKFHLFFTAESKGRYLNDEIKPHYKATRIEEGKKDADEASQSDPD